MLERTQIVVLMSEISSRKPQIVVNTKQCRISFVFVLWTSL